MGNCCLVIARALLLYYYSLVSFLSSLTNLLFQDKLSIITERVEVSLPSFILSSTRFPLSRLVKESKKKVQEKGVLISFSPLLFPSLTIGDFKL